MTSAEFTPGALDLDPAIGITNGEVAGTMVIVTITVVGTATIAGKEADTRGMVLVVLVVLDTVVGTETDMLVDRAMGGTAVTQE